MNGSERWVAVSALGAAMFAIGFSFASVACSTKDISVSEAARAEARTSSAALGSANRVDAASNGAPVVVPVVPSAAARATLPSSSAPAASTSVSSADLTSSGGLKLKRLVVTRLINDREPVEGAEFSVGDGPVYAFVELENQAADTRDIRVLFRNEETKASVGHVKLSIPATQSRFRTWGNTRMIRDPGHWVAVVSTSDGIELGRAAFEVKG